MLNPVSHTLTAEGVEKYKNEPYVLSGDVYSYNNVGEGGWSWYTGAASWAYKCITEKLLGIVFRGERVYFSPSLPKRLRYVRLSIKRKNCELKVFVDNTKTSGEWHMVLDGVGYNNNGIRFGPKLNGKEIRLTRG
jgi:cellobiose phosphorylase